MDLGAGSAVFPIRRWSTQPTNWNELWDSVTRYLPAVKRRISPDKPFAVSLRLASKSANILTASPADRARLKQFFDENGMYLYTANAFPCGSFKAQKDQATSHPTSAFAAPQPRRRTSTNRRARQV